MSAVEPSEYFPVAANCWVEPTTNLAGEVGVNAMEDNVVACIGVGVGEDFGVVVDASVGENFGVVVDAGASVGEDADEQDAMTKAEAAINPIRK
jgi:hypothetical protein